MKFKIRNVIKVVWFSLVFIFFTWQWTNYQSRNLPENTLVSGGEVSVVNSGDEIKFIPSNLRTKSEVIFFQGGLADPKAYAPLCRKIAESGYICHLIKMNWRMPVWGYKKIESMFDLKSGNYILGGHSQGGKMASQFVFEHPGLIKGLFLLGTSHPRDFDLSDQNIPALKLYAELDGLASVPEVLENKAKLPKDADLIEIKGGNHSQFGYLGKLFTDNSPKITLAEQQKITADQLIAFINKVEKQLK